MASNQPHMSESPASAVESKGQNRSPNGSSVEHPSAGTATQMPEPMRTEDEGFIGHLDVYVHHARDIQNICIYHKQDVYAKVCLTTDPDTAFSTRTINGGGRNPVFNENLRLNVRTVESSLKCEVWMLSRVKNYLKDQLLGFALIPVSDVVVANGKIDREFQLSSTELFHSPSGFLQLSISYVGSSPDVMAISAPPTSSVITDTVLSDAGNEEATPCEYEKIEFPDLHAVDENKMMLSEYMGIPCDDLDSAECADNLAAAESNECADDTEAGVRIVESFSVGSADTVELKHDTPQSEVSVNGSPEMDTALSQSLSEPSSLTECANLGKNAADPADHGEVDSSATHSSSVPVVAPVIKINMEPENNVVQQDIVDLYMKSMQQFTESLAKMKLPMDMKDNGSSSAENGKSSTAAAEQKVQGPKGNGARVFYGSRAFF